MNQPGAPGKGHLLRSEFRLVSRPAVSLAAFLFLAFGSRAATVNKAVDYGRFLDHKYSQDPNGGAPNENEMTGQQIQMLDFENAIKARTRTMAQSSPVPSAPAPPVGESFIWTAIVLPCAAFVGAGILGYALKRRIDARLRVTAEAHERRLQEIADDAGLEGFFAELRDALGGPQVAHEPRGESEVVTPNAGAEAIALKEFFASAVGQYAGLRALVSGLARVTEETERRKVLSRLSDEVGSIKESAVRPALHPIWIMTCALEGLLRQLARDTASMTASTQRTAMAAIDLLEALCVPHLNPELATRPAVRILAVDDDPIGRRAISFALKKAFEEPMLAPDGNAALELTAEHDYDVIFLDVEMPGMDGFELCTRIRETARNGTTPVVFVTRHSDFESRKKSALSGGQDLIAKPYHSFEITVKALTLVLGNRLRPGFAAQAVVQKALAAAQPIADSSTNEPVKSGSDSKLAANAWQQTFPETYTATEGAGTSEDSADKPRQSDLPVVPSRSVECLPDTFSAWSPVYLETVRDQLQAVMLCTRPDHLQDLTTGLYMAVHSFSLESERAHLPAIHRLSAALEAMLKKLMEKPKLCAPSVWNSALAALELLGELPCRTDGGPDINNQSPQILVVDDDPVALRAISGAIQLVFGKPANADDGETALAMATEKRFDLVLLDVLMPGMDGFEACSKIRKTELNRRTPVIFISNHDDADSRQKAAMSGGSGFVPKPVFSSQITLTALTSILRSRLEDRRPDVVAPVQMELAAIEA